MFLNPGCSLVSRQCLSVNCWIIIGSVRRPKTKQGIEGKIDRFRSGTVRVRDRVRGRYN